MKTYKLTPLEQLKLEEKQLREEIKISEQKMVFQLQYVNDNWGAMLLKGVTSSIMNKVSDTFEHSSPASSASYLTRSIGSGGWSWGNLLLSNYKSIGSIGWKVLKPLALTFLTKKATSKLFPKRKKR